MSVLDRIKSGELGCCVYEINFYGVDLEEKENVNTKELLELAEIGEWCKWISVEKPLIEEELYLVTIQGTTIVLIKPFTGRFEEVFTHWMSIPALPVNED